MLVVSQIIGNTFRAMGQIKDLIQPRLADIQTHNNNFLTHIGQTDCRISSNKRLTFTRLCGCKKHHFLTGTKHEQHIGTQTTKSLLHHTILILLNHNGTFFGLLT